MKMRVRIWEELEVDGIRCVLPVRYEEEDMPNDFPFREGDTWKVTLDLNTGKIRDWPGPAAEVHMKVVDMGCYYLLSGDRIVAKLEEEYVPGCIPEEYGDYVTFDIAADGTLKGWKPRASEVFESFFSSDE